MTTDDVIYHGYAAPVGPDWRPVNGSRGRHRDQSVDIDMGVVHFWVSGELPPDRFLNQLRTPALPGSGVCYQSTDGRGGWSWESATGGRITDRTKARPYRGRTYDILRAGVDQFGRRHPPLHLMDGDPMPWCYGPGYPVVLGTDGEPHFAANPDDIACNHAPPFNDRSIGAVFPGTYQTDEGWKDATSNAMIEALAKLIVYSYHRWGIPIRYCNVDDLLAGRTGWTGHRDVNEMQRRLGKTGVSGHGDPGVNCPWPRIINRALEILEGEDDMDRLCNIREIPADWPTHPCVLLPGFYVDHGGVLEPISSVHAAVRSQQKSIKGDPTAADSISAIDRNTLKSYRLHPGTLPYPPISPLEFMV